MQRLHWTLLLIDWLGVIENLVVYPKRMKGNLDRLGGLHNSQRVLLALTQAGLSREDSYRLVQRNAMKTWEEGKDFLEELKADREVTARVGAEDLEAMFDLGYHTKHVDDIFGARVWKKLKFIDGIERCGSRMSTS